MNIKKIIAALFLCLSTFSAFSQITYFDKLEQLPKYSGMSLSYALKMKKYATLVAMKIIPVYEDVDFEYLREARMLGKNFYDKPDLLLPPGCGSIKDIYAPGELMFCAASANKERNTVQFRKAILFFNSSNKMKLHIPLYIETKIPDPKEVDVLYYGTIIITYTGNDFKIKSIKVIDEYDEALEELNKLNTNKKKQINLVRSEWVPYKPDPLRK